MCFLWVRLEPIWWEVNRQFSWNPCGGWVEYHVFHILYPILTYLLTPSHIVCCLPGEHLLNTFLCLYCELFKKWLTVVAKYKHLGLNVKLQLMCLHEVSHSSNSNIWIWYGLTSWLLFIVLLWCLESLSYVMFFHAYVTLRNWQAWWFLLPYLFYCGLNLYLIKCLLLFSPGLRVNMEMRTELCIRIASL